MGASRELNRLLTLVEWDPRLNVVEGLDAFRGLLEDDADGHVLRFLNLALPKLQGQRLAGIAFVIAEHCRIKCDLSNLQKLFATEGVDVKESVLDALQGEPGGHPQMGAGILQMAIEGIQHESPAVRIVACSVVQNQCSWGVDVKDAIMLLQDLLKDAISRVRVQASYAIGTLAKHKYNMSASISQLRRNVKHDDMYVREASAWALWQLSRSKHDITAAIPDLIWLLTDKEEYNEQRKKAASALLHHAKKSSANTKAVKEHAGAASFNLELNEVRKFVVELNTLK